MVHPPFDYFGDINSFTHNDGKNIRAFVMMKVNSTAKETPHNDQ
ncbi:MAG: hypothetical protein N3F62_00880 [Bacteroidia bacterium]|nr:hypothetical protein [Bacteroidia bacterium]